MNQSYDQKSTAYFSTARRDIDPLLPPFAERVLEVGCGNGATLQALKMAGKVGHAHGLELFEQMAEQAAMVLDEVTVGNAETLLPNWPAEQYDLILCLDVLEHLVDPWALVDQCARLLKPGGSLIASVPNMRTAPVMYKLLVKGQFDYAQEGIMDRTHLRWFTKKSALELLDRPPLRLQRWIHSPLAPHSKSDRLNRLTGGLLRDWVTIQYLIRADKA